MTTLLPCPFCGSANIDPEGWASIEQKGPACDDCGASADTVELWNKRPECDRLRKALAAAGGYLMNAKIDLETGAPKRTAIRTIEGGLKVVETAAAQALTAGKCEP